MKNLPQISEAEFEVMKIVWKYAPINTNEITEKLLQTTNKDGIKYTIYKYDLFPDEWIYHARVLQTSHYLIPIVGVKYTQ